MKIKHIWSVLCKESIVNQDDNLISIHGMLEELNVSLTSVDASSNKLPEKLSVPFNYEIVSFWIKENKKELAKAQIEYSLVNPEGKELFNKIQDMEIPADKKRFRSRMKIVGMPITMEGDYNFRVTIKEEGEDSFRLVAELPLEVKINLQKPSVKPKVKN